MGGVAAQIGLWCGNQLRTRTYTFALVLTIGLLIANGIVLPSFADPSTYALTLATLAPFALAAVASTPSILSGGGGIDISIGPLMSLVNIVLVVELIPHGLGSAPIAIPIVLVLGAAVGLANGLLVTSFRFPPVIATLATFFIVLGVNAKLAEEPQTAPPNWTDDLAGDIGPIPGSVFVIVAPLLLWLLLERSSYVRNLLAVGGDEAAAYAAGVRVGAVRLIAYSLGGAFAAIGGIALTGLLHSAEARTGVEYTLIALAAVALGGTPLTGGRGGLLGPALGAATVFLVQNLLLALSVNVFWLQAVYGLLLIVAVVLGARLNRLGPAAGVA